MKKTFLSLLLLAGISTASLAQESSVLLYGNAGFSSNTDAGNSKTTNYSFSPGVGYQFSENWTAGIGLGLNGSKTEVSNTGDVFKSSQFSVGPFVRYTQKLSDIFSLFGQANFNYLSSKFEPVNQSIRKTNGFNVGIIPAVQMNVKNGFALNFGFGGIEFGSQKVDAPGANSTNSFNFTFGQQVNFGISKNFGGKK